MRRIVRRKRIKERIADGSFRIGRGTKAIYGHLDFTGDGSIHLGEDCILGNNFAVRLRESQITVGDRCFIAAGTMVLAARRIEIGNDVLIGEGCYISDNDGHSLDLDIRKQDVANRRKGLKVWDGIAAVPVIIGDNAWIAPRSIVLKGVTIGRGAVIGAGSVVTKDVPPMTLAAGNPARIIRTLDSQR
jgi:galactoside O-acetyltransferase